MKYTKDIIAIIIILLAGVSLFIVSVNETAVQFIRLASGIVIGYYFGTNKSSILSFAKKQIKK